MEGGGGGRGEQLRAEGGAGQARDGVAGPGDAAGSSDGGDGGDSGSARGWIGDVQVLSGATAIEHLLRTAEPVVQGSSEAPRSAAPVQSVPRVLPFMNAPMPFNSVPALAPMTHWFASSPIVG